MDSVIDKLDRGLLLVFTAFVLTQSATPARAAGERDETADANYVGGHRFSPSFVILTPFAKPSLTAGLSLVFAHPPSPLVSEDLDIVGASPAFEGHIPIIENLVLNVRAAGFVAAGVDAVSALSFGASTATRLQLGALYQFIDSSDIALTGALTVAKPKLYAVSPLVDARAYLRNVFKSGSADVDFTSESTQWYPSVRFAYALTPTFGLQGSFGAQFFLATDNEGARSQLALSLGIDTQLKPELNIPVALGVIYARNQVLTRQGNQDVNTFLFSVFETISSRFNFGTEFGWISLPSTTAFSLGVMARYYY